MNVPEHAQCKNCGYALRDLPEAVCPECGRGFDPDDPKSYDSSLPRTRRRWIKRIALVAIAALVIYVLWPQGMVRSSLTFRCQTCGYGVTVTRRELRAPSWFRFRYPGFNSTEEISAPASEFGSSPADGSSCLEHDYAVGLDLTLLDGGGIHLGGGTPIGGLPTINGLFATPETAGDVLKQVMGSRTGINMSMGPGKPPGSSRAGGAGAKTGSKEGSAENGGS